jgi:hypothetical protein
VIFFLYLAEFLFGYDFNKKVLPKIAASCRDKSKIAAADPSTDYLDSF